MFGEGALRLVTEAKACVALDTVKAYNDELIRALILETKQLHTHLSGMLQTLQERGDSMPPEDRHGLQSQILIIHLMVQYNKRAMLIYHNTRIDILTRALATSSACFFSLPVLYANNPTLKSLLSPSEQDYLRSYAALLQTTKLAYLDLSPQISLDISTATPSETLPRSTLVTIRVNKDLSDVWISDSYTHPINLQKGQSLTINAKDLPHFLKHGWATVVEPGI